MRQEKGHIPYPNSATETELYHFTINGNMQAYIYDNLIYTYYGYDNANSRKYKISYQNTPTWINGQPQPTELHIRNMMFYPNSYLNFNADGYYTKHYYNGMERIASRLGDQGFGMEQPTDGDLLSRKNDLGKVFTEQFQEMLGNQDSIKLHDTLQLRDLQPNPAGGLYFYHPNHLGSTCYVTDENASVVQGFLYAPFGEITNEYNSSFGSSVLPKYSFNAKELDEETGMYYYEARYMAPPVFISRDPLFEKYPTFSPYAYCANNPVKYVDPDGRDWFENELTGEVFYNSQMGKNDAGKGDMTGDGWKWMGKNDMFGKVDAAFMDDNAEFLYSNGAQLSGYTMQTLNDGLVGVDEMRFGGNSEAFMSKMGYERKPLTAIVDVVEYTQIIDNDINGAPKYNTDKHDVSPIKILTSTYVKKKTPYSYEITDKTKPFDKQIGPLIRKTTWSETRKYHYGKNDSRSLIKSTPTILELFKDFILLVSDKTFSSCSDQQQLSIKKQG